MASGTGFGTSKATKQPSKSASKRAAASKQYDQMKTSGAPEFNIYIRIKDKKNWYPVGSLAVNRTNQINQAIYQSEEDLRQGAFRLFPILKKNQANLEYGYRLKGTEFNDEPIELASPPQPSIPGAFQAAVDKVKDTFSNLFKRG